MFAVPTELVDRHLKLAGAVQLKVLLWTLRHSGEPVDEQVLSQALGIARADAADAMLYWQECGLVAKAEGEGQGLQPPPRPHPRPRRKSPSGCPCGRRSRTMLLLPSAWRKARTSLSSCRRPR